MNTFLYTAMAFCVVSCTLPALAQYQATAYGGGYSQQRKMAPTPQTYGQNQQQQSGYGAAAASAASADAYEQPSYGRTAPMAQTQYEERQQPSAASSYGRQMPSAYGATKSSGYGQQQASYSKPAAPKYEEPYHPPMPFAWGYDINDGYGGAQYHKENGDEYGKRTGSYGYTDAYGIYRQVDYVADEHGFRATIKTNEPGTANESPADVELHAYEPPSNYYAGNSGYSGNSGSSYGSKGSSSYGSKGSTSGGSYGSGSSGYAAASSAPAAAYSAATPASAAPSYSQAGALGAQNAYSSQRSAVAPSSQSYTPTKQASMMLMSPYASRQAVASSGSQQYGGSSEPAGQYSSSVIVPVYQKPNAASSLSAVPKALIAAAAPAKRHL